MLRVRLSTAAAGVAVTGFDLPQKMEGEEGACLRALLSSTGDVHLFLQAPLGQDLVTRHPTACDRTDQASTLRT